MLEKSNTMNKTELVTDTCELWGYQIKKARLEKNLTQQQLAELVGVSRGKIVAAEKGSTKIQTYVAIMLALEKKEELEVMLHESEKGITTGKTRRKKLRKRASGNDEYLADEQSDS